jgi:chitin synthase
MIKLLATDIIKIVITSISIIDFLVFVVLFLSFMICVPYKAKETSTKVMSIGIIIFFIVFKTLHIPVFISTLPMNVKIPGSDIIIGILTWSNILLAAVPLILAIITAFIYKTPKKDVLEKFQTKNVNIIMPIYNESPESLLKAVQSVLNLEYPKQLIHLYLAFDEGVKESNSDAFVYLMKYYNLDPMDKRYRVDIDLDGIIISICRFEHGGKKSAQYGAFKEMESDNKDLDNSLVFFIDSDIILMMDSLSQFTYFLEKNKKSALTGIISCIASGNPTFLTFYQDIEYISGQIFWRNLEVYFGSTTCLPGAFTILKYSFLKRVSDIYFNSTEYKDDTDYQRFYLGEDRYLTHLLMEIEPWQLGFCEAARCKTDAPNTMSALLKQRRRWYLGHIANDTWMISSLKLWKTYPLLCLFNLLNNTRNTSIYIYLLYFVLLLNKETNVLTWSVFILMPLLLNWFFIIIYALKIKRKMNILSYCAIVFLQPILSMMYMYYTIWTIRQKSWGGIRVERKDTTTLSEVVVVEN